MLNLSSLLYSTAEQPTFEDALDLTPSCRERILAAKSTVRLCLRDRFPQVLRESGYNEQVVSPRFFTQGSWAYKTLNAPAKPAQQADIDDGAYLPLSFVAQTEKPSAASAIFFAAIEECLSPLTQTQGWRLRTDKATCVRIEIASFAHIDIPLYAIPDNEFSSLQKASMQRGYMDAQAAVFGSDEDVWTKLPTNRVLLAHREYDWVKSDPRPLKTWFLQEVERHGEQFRRVVRYLKAFRDWQWESGGPASVLLMAATAQVFDSRDRRDDLALLDVAAKLPSVLRDGVNNPVEGSESFTERLGKHGVEDAATKFQQLETQMRWALQTTNAEQACALMVDLFGSRFPNEPSRAIKSSVAATVLATPAVTIASPLVGRTKAG